MNHELEINLAGKSAAIIEADDLKQALNYYFRRVSAPESGYVLVEDGKNWYQLTLENSEIIHKGEVVFRASDVERLNMIL